MSDSDVCTFGDYIVTDELGKGGFSTVYLCEHGETGQEYALKVLGDKALQDGQLDQLISEIETLQKIDHKNVIKIVDYLEGSDPESGRKTYGCPGGDFFEFLVYCGGFDEDLARTFFHQIIDGLEAIHKTDVAHRDMKPENIMLNDEFQVKIADFGFAKFVPESGFLETILGTEQYKAPELHAKKKYTSAVDIFSTGVILFISITGFPPFNQATKQDWWWNAIVKGKPNLFWKAHDRSHKMSNPAKDLIIGMLHPDPKKRFTIKDIRKSKWYQQQTIGKNKLMHVLSNRREKIKTRKLEEARKQEVESDIVMDSDGGSRVYRGELDFHLPTTLPSFEKKQVEEKKTHFKAEPKKLPIWKSKIMSYTYFTSKQSADSLMDLIGTTLQKINAQKVILNKFNARFTTSGCRLRMNVFQHPKEDRRVVVFKRLSGDSLEYMKVFKLFMAHHFSSIADYISVVDTDVEDHRS